MPDATAPKPQDIALETIEGTHNTNLLLLCDHASKSLPDGWDGLGLSPEQLEKHIAWDIGVLWRQDVASAERLIAALVRDESLYADNNQPYSALEMPGYTVEGVLEPRKLRHVIIEIRQDLITGSAGVEAWADRLAKLSAGEFGFVGPQ